MLDSTLKGSYLAFIILGLIEKTTSTIMYVCVIREVPLSISPATE